VLEHTGWLLKIRVGTGLIVSLKETFYLSVENQLNKRVVIYSYREQDTGSTPVFSTIFFMGNNCNICSNKCWGYDGYHGSCCSLEDRNYIIGPHHDHEKFLIDLKLKLGRDISYQEVFIDFEEGSKMFPEKECWQDPRSYPCLRINLESHNKSCIFYNNFVRACMVYEIRPETCQNYECEFLTEHTKLTS